MASEPPHGPQVPDPTGQQQPQQLPAVATAAAGENVPPPPSKPPRAARKRQSSPHTRTRIVTERESGATLRALADKYDLAVSTVRGIILRYPTQKSAVSNNKSGRPQAFSAGDKRRILDVVAQDPSASCKDIKERTGLGCHSRTILRYLKKEGITYSTTGSRPKLTGETIRKRVLVALKNVEEASSKGGGEAGGEAVREEVVQEK
ncbi:uncharacterized protein DNG_10310 [Cephalotrichum gorgonifer]|uniref:Transposase Tc1-like domain-containing protein n=1 Tax=Cephalotrichum gorgonifer TaxID=2041049 RepID=A0AAE8N9E4_9PEZI|nr:uncharacterized protein DNG_10310 [Cephalotrichum gorgonifer]